MATFSARSVYHGFVRTCAILGVTATSALSDNLCPDNMGTPQFDPANHDLCQSLWPQVRSPSANGAPKPLNEYEAAVGEFFNNFCYRDPNLTMDGKSWGQDKWVRDTGPYVAHRNEDNKWIGEYHGFHAPVVIWYSPEVMDWLKVNRPIDGSPEPENPAPIPDGAIIVKEMYTAPGSRCREASPDRSVANLKPANGIAYMVRDSKASWDGWFWGYFGFYDPGTENPNIDWPVAPGRDNGAAYAGFGQYCVNCHASAEDNSTFSSLANIKGFDEKPPLDYLSQDWFLTAVESDVPEHVPAPTITMAPIPNSTPLGSAMAAFDKYFHLKDGAEPLSVARITLPSQLYDNVWAGAKDPATGTPPMSSEYLTSDQCLSCHDAGSTGLRFDMTKPNPHGDNLINLSPYATWRSSPMGLAGRDPIFFAQLSSEEQLHPGTDAIDLIWNTCFGCHGIMGQRQFQLDNASSTAECEKVVFNPDFVTSVPYSGAPTDNTGSIHYDPEHAKYGALARDGISCVACHRAALTPEQTAEYADQEQNKCVIARQEQLNKNIGSLEGFGKTFTGSFLVAGPGEIFGPFDAPKTKPMDHALGNIPEHDSAIASSEQCGTCHTVHLPVLWQPPGEDLQIIADTYEQTTYPEWLFSQYRTGDAAFLELGETLAGGEGETPVSCVGCHMESRDSNGMQLRSRIASIQERSNMPGAEYVLPAEDIDLEVRDGFARHTLVGLNLFLVKMAQQFPDVFGIPLMDPMLTKKGMAGLQRTEAKMVENAETYTADISITERRIVTDAYNNEVLNVGVRIDNHAGHKFPSGVSFRRAFVEFEVLDVEGNVIWHSGGTDEMGVILDGATKQPVKGELWYNEMCEKVVDKDDFMPHFQEVTEQSQVQIYQEVKLNPGEPGKTVGTPSCAEDQPIDALSNLTTSFLSICHTQKDNRLLPAGLLSYETRVEIGNQMGLFNKTRDGSETEAEMLATETGAWNVGNDEDYITGGGDGFVYKIKMSDFGDKMPDAVRATLHYQATPPFFLQDRFCTGEGANRDRLYHLASLLDTKDTPIADWKFRMVSTGMVPLTP